MLEAEEKFLVNAAEPFATLVDNVTTLFFMNKKTFVDRFKGHMGVDIKKQITC